MISIASSFIAIVLCGVIPSVITFSQPLTTHRITHHYHHHHLTQHRPQHHIHLTVHHSTTNEDFDPLLSPHAYVNGADADPIDINEDGGTDITNRPFISETSEISRASSSSSTFGFEVYASSTTQVQYETTTADNNNDNNGEGEDLFDPLLSPHAYAANGVDETPVDIEDEVNQQTTNMNKLTTTGDADDFFDPLLSPHAYANGVDEAPINLDSTTASAAAASAATSSSFTRQEEKIGVLLIDHGSKRDASNQHIMNVAQLYENRIITSKQQQVGFGLSAAASTTSSTKTTTIVRAAHMEIAPPSILTKLRSLIIDDKATKIICVPYFLSPGKHATEDIPQLISEAKAVLRGEGLLSNNSEVEDANNDGCGDGKTSIMVSNALGTHMEGMLGAIDDLVDWTLN